MTDSERVTPFHLHVPDEALDDLRRPLSDTRWPDQPAGTGWPLGPPVDYPRELAQYWRDKYDWRAAEGRINAYPQFTTEINGHVCTSCTSGRPSRARCR